jgi:uncharacterized protein (TIGR00297 family)
LEGYAPHRAAASVSPADGVVLAAALGSLGLAWGRAWLTWGALPVAALVGAAVWWGTGPAGVSLLLFFFVTSSALTRLRRWRARADYHRRVPHHRSPRNGRQVLANGAAASVAALVAGAFGIAAAVGAVAGALAAATADTWASELGRTAAGPTWLITTGERVSPGHSGGLSVAGTAAGLAGAVALGLLWGALGGPPAPRAALASLVAGATGMSVDSLLGATLERRVRWVGNDVVNLAGTCAGAAVGWFLAAHAGA